MRIVGRRGKEKRGGSVPEPNPYYSIVWSPFSRIGEGEGGGKAPNLANYSSTFSMCARGRCGAREEEGEKKGERRGLCSDNAIPCFLLRLDEGGKKRRRREGVGLNLDIIVAFNYSLSHQECSI